MTRTKSRIRPIIMYEILLVPVVVFQIAAGSLVMIYDENVLFGASMIGFAASEKGSHWYPHYPPSYSSLIKQNMSVLHFKQK
ncbi:hypothetical protein ACTXT7_016339 [Hymenolepis weldensis]